MPFTRNNISDDVIGDCIPIDKLNTDIEEQVIPNNQNPDLLNDTPPE